MSEREDDRKALAFMALTHPWAARIQAQIEALESQLEAAEAIMTGLSAKVEALEGTVAWYRETFGAGETTEAATARDSRIEALEGALRKIEAVQPATVAMLRREGFVFETPLQESEGWEKLAFTLYSTICESDAIARAALAGEPDVPRNNDGTPWLGGTITTEVQITDPDLKQSGANFQSTVPTGTDP